MKVRDVKFENLQHVQGVGESGKLGIVKIEGTVVYFAAILREIRDTTGAIAQALADVFGSDCEPDVQWSFEYDGYVCSFQRDFCEPIRNPEQVSKLVRNALHDMEERLVGSMPSPCG